MTATRATMGVLSGGALIHPEGLRESHCARARVPVAHGLLGQQTADVARPKLSRGAGGGNGAENTTADMRAQRRDWCNGDLAPGSVPLTRAARVATCCATTGGCWVLGEASTPPRKSLHPVKGSRSPNKQKRLVHAHATRARQLPDHRPRKPGKFDSGKVQTSVPRQKSRASKVRVRSAK
jgi:hypothetical protein